MNTSPDIKIIIADDHEIFRDGLKLMLSKYPEIIILGEACNGKELIQLTQELQPDVVVTDIKMPVMDGYAVLKRIRGNARFAALRVLAVTAFAMQGNREQVLAAGFDGYLSKPIDIAVLTKELRQFLG
jgi:DNA-binding NarL/FixJ family response regulator